MPAQLIINSKPYETRVALLEDGRLAELYIERHNFQDILGNIYKGKVVRVLPGIQAAFVDIGAERTGFLGIQDIVSNQDQARIEDFVFEGQEIVVQVIKAPTKGKGPRLTTNLAIAGRRLVLMPYNKNIGISKKIKEKEERERLKKIANEIRPEKEMGLIVRTISKGIEKDKLKQEMDFLYKLWKDIKKKSKTHSAPSIIHREPSIILKSIRDLFTRDVDKLVIDSVDGYKQILNFINDFAPGLRYSIELYKGEKPIFEEYGIEEKINTVFKRKVPLKSGGFIVIEQTEALTAIDVNSGSYVGENNLEETALKINLEAVKEIAYQVRLRNISGLIVIDFIDMEKKSHRDKVFTALKEAFSKDRSKTNIQYISTLGLIEMTRERTRLDLKEVLAEECPYCSGRGLVKSKESICYEIFRELERRKNSLGSEKIHVFLNADVEEFIKEYKGRYVEEIERRIGKKVVFVPKKDMHIEEYEIIN